MKGKVFQADKDELDAQQGGNLHSMTAMRITYIGDFHKLFPFGDLMSASWKRWHLGRALIGRIRLWMDKEKALWVKSGNEERKSLHHFISPEQAWRKNGFTGRIMGEWLDSSRLGG